MIILVRLSVFFFFFQAEDGIRDATVTGVQTCALPILELVQTLESRGDLRDVEGIAFKDKAGVVIKNEDRPPIADLDSLHFPPYHFFNFGKYIRYSSPIMFKGKKAREMKSSNIMASRGCPFNCRYCSVTKYWRGQCRLRSVEN